MNPKRWRDVLSLGIGTGRFPHELSWLIDNPVRRVLLTPATLADRLDLKESASVLEVGPGSGYFSVELAHRVPQGRLELLDLQPEMLVKAKRKLAAAGCQNVGFTAHDATSPFPFAAETFDAVILVAVLGEVQDARSCLSAVHHVLRRCGLLVIHEHIPDPDRIPFTALQPLVEECGYRLRRRWGPFWNYTAIFARLSA